MSDGSSFNNYTSFEAAWSYRYPWGSDHNGTARMYASSTDHSHVFLNADTSLTLMATRQSDPNNSISWPFLPISFHSGTIYSKNQITISSSYPYWELSGNFKAPTTAGTWPAFWSSGAVVYPPESDILEFKGDTWNWQNTLDSVGRWQTKKTTVADAATTWHNYKVAFNLRKDTLGNWTDHVDCIYFIDDSVKALHLARNMAGKTMNVIIDLQMEGVSGTYIASADTIRMHAKKVTIRKGTTQLDPAAWYQIINHANFVAAVPNGSKTPGTGLIRYNWLGGNEQQWNINIVSGNYVSITNRNSNQVMAIGSASTTSGVAVIQWPWLGGNEQQWLINRLGNGYYSITNRNSGLAITQSGGNLVQASYTGSNYQQWHFIKIQ